MLHVCFQDSDNSKSKHHRRVPLNTLSPMDRFASLRKVCQLANVLIHFDLRAFLVINLLVITNNILTSIKLSCSVHIKITAILSLLAHLNEAISPDSDHRTSTPPLACASPTNDHLLHLFYFLLLTPLPSQHNEQSTEWQ